MKYFYFFTLSIPGFDKALWYSALSQNFGSKDLLTTHFISFANNDTTPT